MSKFFDELTKEQRYQLFRDSAKAKAIYHKYVPELPKGYKNKKQILATARANMKLQWNDIKSTLEPEVAKCIYNWLFLCSK